MQIVEIVLRQGLSIFSFFVNVNFCCFDFISAQDAQ